MSSRASLSFHTKLKNWLIELGKKEYGTAYSGDTRPIDIREKRRRSSYTFNPDVIWKCGAEQVIFELAFTEDWRAIVGEVMLTAISGVADKLFIVTNREDEGLSTLISILNDKIGDQVRWGVTHIPVRSLKDAKKQIPLRLRKGKYI